MNTPDVHSLASREAFAAKRAPAIAAAEEETGGCCRSGARSAGSVNWKRFAVGAAFAGPTVEGSCAGFGSVVALPDAEPASPPATGSGEGSTPPRALRSATTARPTMRPCWRSMRPTSTCNKSARPSAVFGVARDEKAPVSFPCIGFGPCCFGGSHSHAVRVRSALVSNEVLDTGDRMEGRKRAVGTEEAGSLPNLCR